MVRVLLDTDLWGELLLDSPIRQGKRGCCCASTWIFKIEHYDNNVFSGCVAFSSVLPQ